MSDSPIENYQADTLRIEVPVTFDAGAPITTMAGGTAVAFIRKDGEAAIIAGTATLDPGGALAIASWPSGTLTPGLYIVQMRVTKDGFTKSILDERVIIKPSL